jgi:hypothetical protein
MNKEIAGSAGWAGGILALAVGATIAHKLGFVDRDTVTRLVIGINGLMIAWYGNRIPKRFAPSACARQAQRVAGWSQVLSGLAYAGLWAFAPMDVAIWGGMAAVAAGVLITLGYCLSLQSKAKTG